jgi:hypothetical protein
MRCWEELSGRGALSPELVGGRRRVEEAEGQRARPSPALQRRIAPGDSGVHRLVPDEDCARPVGEVGERCQLV